MKNYLPSILALGILVGLVTFTFSINYLTGQLKVTSINEKHAKKIYLKYTSRYDSVTLSKIVTAIPRIDKNKDTTENGSRLENKHTTKEKSENKDSIYFYLNMFPSTLTWIIFHSIVLSIGSLLSILLLIYLFSIKKELEIHFLSKKSLKNIIPIVLLIISLTIFVNNIQQRVGVLVAGDKIMEYFGIVFKNPSVVIGNIINCIFLIGTIPLFGIVLINVGIGNLNKTSNNLKNHYKRLRDALNIFGFFSGILIAVAIIGTNLQRKMIAEQVIGINKIYPDEFIYAYGASFTLILALFFLPILFYLKYSKSVLEINLEEENNNLSWWKIGQESVDDIKVIFSITLPLITSVLQPFLNIG